MHMLMHVHSCTACSALTMRETCPRCGGATAPHSQRSEPHQHVPSPPSLVPKHRLPNTAEFSSHSEVRCQLDAEQLRRITVERDALVEEVRAMGAQRVWGTQKIKELMEENKELRAALEAADVRRGIAEIEQQSLLQETNALRRQLADALSQVSDEKRHQERQRAASLHSLANGMDGTPLSSSFIPNERSPCNEGVGFESFAPNEQMTLNRRLEARCRVLEGQVRRLRERLVEQRKSPPDETLDDVSVTPA